MPFPEDELPSGKQVIDLVSVLLGLVAGILIATCIWLAVLVN